nr:PKD domain-containing protein [Candidatus Sigynarchaeota archaeon]
MSLRKRKVVGELTKRDVVKGIVVASIFIAILLAAWIFVPTVIDTIFGGSRGGYDTDVDLPEDWEYYNQTAITVNITINMPDPNLFDPTMLQDLLNMFDPSGFTLTGDFGQFNQTNFNIPLFFYEDWNIGTDFFGLMRQNCFDTISADQATWSRSTDQSAFISSSNIVSQSPSYRLIKFNLTSTASINLRLPFFPYRPQYMDYSLGFADIGGNPASSQAITPDKTALVKDINDLVSCQAPGLQSNANANLTYKMRYDPSMSEAEQNDYMNGSPASLAPGPTIPTNFSSYLQIPSVNPATRNLAPYLSGHTNFNNAYVVLLGQGLNKDTTPVNQILQGIGTYLTSRYSLFTGVPERPPAGGDMIEWFLGRPASSFPTGSGTPYDFAAAFTMLARAFNIPARLVTGFDDWNHDNIISVAEVHAWSEAFLPTAAAPAFRGKWIMYNTLPGYSTGNITGPLVPFIHIDNPAPGQTFNYMNNLPLNLVMYSDVPITDVTYALDSGTNISVNVYRQSDGGGFYHVNHTFNVASNGTHTVQAYMHLSNGTVLSTPPIGFVVIQETATIRVDAPVNNAAQLSSIFPLDYTVLNNASSIRSAYYHVYYENDSYFIQNQALPAVTHYAGTFIVMPYGRFYIVVHVVTDLWNIASSRVWFNHTSSNLQPSAEFNPSVPITIIQNQSVLFSHTGSNGNMPATYYWNFGDGTTETTENPSHTFLSTGIFNVSLTVTDSDGEFDTVTRPYLITVTTDLLPNAAFFANQTMLYLNQQAGFTHTGSHGNMPATHQWNFGDGTPNSTAESPAHQYMSAGTYTVTLTVTDVDADSNTVRRTNYIIVTNDLFPNAAFHTNATFINASQYVAFTHDGSNGNAPATYQWNFGDGPTNATIENPTHQYTSVGTYAVTLTVTDNDGDRHTFRNAACVYVGIVNTSISGLMYNPLTVDLFDNITISGNLLYENNHTGFGGQYISIRIEYYIGTTLQGIETCNATTTSPSGLFTASHQVRTASDRIRIIATFTSPSMYFLSSTAMVEG